MADDYVLPDDPSEGFMSGSDNPPLNTTPDMGVDWSQFNSGSGINWGDLIKKYGSSAATLIGAGLGASGLLNSSPQKTGYQGKIPILSATRQQLPIDYNAPRRPGSGGRRYFTDMTYAPKSGIASVAPGVEAPVTQAPVTKPATPTAPTTPSTTPSTTPTAPAVVAPFYDYTNNQPTRPINPTLGSPEFNIPSNVPVDPSSGLAEIQQQYANQGYTDYIPSANVDYGGNTGAAHGGLISGYAQGGIADLGYYLGGKTDGMADKIPAQIDDKQQAKLSHGEFVIPSDIVSALGSGNSSAGAKGLYDMLDRIRKHAHGTTPQIKPAH